MIKFLQKNAIFSTTKNFRCKICYQTGDSHVLHQVKSRPRNLKFKM